jgi:hypothetical protein
MQTVAEIFALWRTDAELGRDIGLPYPTVSAWKQRGSIPAAYWRDIVRAARRRGHPEVTAELLVNLHARNATGDTAGGFAEEDAAPITPHPRMSKVRAARDAASDTGHFTRWKHLRRSHFATAEEIEAHVDVLRDEWKRR